MIYLDTSVAFATLFGEQRRPADGFWSQEFISSRLLQYELLVRANAHVSRPAAVDAALEFLDEMTLVDLDQAALARALQPFPMVVRTLDALHLATMEFLRLQGLEIVVATYDRRLADAAKALGFELADV